MPSKLLFVLVVLILLKVDVPEVAFTLPVNVPVTFADIVVAFNVPVTVSA